MTTPSPLIVQIQEALARGNLRIPVFHPVAVKLQGLLSRSDYSMGEVCELITTDQALSTQILKVANSPYYSGLHQIATIGNAVVRLGAHEVANIAMLATQQETYRSADPLFSGIMQDLWRHAMACAVGSKWLAQKIGYDDLAQEAFLAGLLHDVGKLFLLKVIEDICRSSPPAAPISPALIAEVLEVLHVPEGYKIMQLWNLPEIYSTVVQAHHLEQWDTANSLLTVVRLVNLACHKLGVGMRHDAGLMLYATTEAQVLGVKEVTLAELEIAIEDALQQVA
jgi:HD-like signal output (HDOD) protein